MIKKETLNYVRPARKKKDGHDGFIYMHHWATGFQELIFDTHEKAKQFERTLNTKTEKIK